MRYLPKHVLCLVLLFAAPAWADEGAPTEGAVEVKAEEPTAEPAREVSETPESSTAAAAETAVPSASSSEIVSVSASASFRMLAVSDPDPANDRSIVYGLKARVGFPLKGLSTSVMMGVTERFVAEEGDSAIRLGDSAMNVGYRHSHLDKTLSVSHRIGAWLPTSRSSLRRELRVAPTVRSGVSFAVFGPLTVGYSAQGQYRWYRYAEVPNRLAMNTQWILGNSLNLGVDVLDHGTFGKMSFALSSGLRWMRKYPSRDDHVTDAADQALWNQMFTWSAGLSYAPIRWIALNIGADHGTSFRRNGIINPFIAHRDATELSFGLTARY